MTSGAAAGRDFTLGEARATVKAEREVEHEAATSPVVCRPGRRAATGTKTHTGLREAPQAVFVVTRDEMDGQGIQSLSEALRCTSGVRVEEGQTSANSLFMRAFIVQGKPAWMVCAFARMVISATSRKNLWH